MNKRNKDLLTLSSLLKKITAAVFRLGVLHLNRPSEKLFLRSLYKVEPSLYIFRNNFRSRITVGFRTFYCGVNTYVPPEFKNYWISDHHFLSLFLRIGSQSLTLMPYGGNIYTVDFKRTLIPNYLNPEDLKNTFVNFSMIDDLSSWIELFYFNNDTSILSEQGIVFPDFKIFSNDKMQDMVKIYQMSCGIRRIVDARKDIISSFEKFLASIL